MDPLFKPHPSIEIPCWRRAKVLFVHVVVPVKYVSCKKIDMFLEPLTLLSFYQVIICGVGHENTTRRGRIEFWQAKRNRSYENLFHFTVCAQKKTTTKASKQNYLYIYKHKHKQGCLTDNLLKAYCECWERFSGNNRGTESRYKFSQKLVLFSRLFAHIQISEFYCRCCERELRVA